MKNKILFDVEQQLKRKLKNNRSYDAVEKNALRAIIDHDDVEFSRPLKIMNKRKTYDGYLRVKK